MRRRFVLLGLLAPLALLAPSDAAAGPPADEFDIFTGLTASEGCSCAFVVGQMDAYCVGLGAEEGQTATITIDHVAMTATSTFISSTRTSRFTAGAGCVLDALP